MILLILALQAATSSPPIIDAPSSIPIIMVAQLDGTTRPPLPPQFAAQSIPAKLPVVAAKDPWAILPCGGTKTHLVC